MSNTPETDAESRRINFDNALYPTAAEGYKALTKFARTLERQRDEARAEATEAKANQQFGWETAREAHKQYDKEHTEMLALRAEVARLTSERNEWQCSALLYHSELRDLAAGKKVETNLGYPVEKLIQELRTEVAQRRKAMADIVRELGCGCCGLVNEEIAPEVKKVMAELATLRATMDAQHATIDAAAAACAQDLRLTSAKGIIATHMRTLGVPQVDHQAAIEAKPTTGQLLGANLRLQQELADWMKIAEMEGEKRESLEESLGAREHELRELRQQLHEIDVSTEGYVDGAPDCSALSSLCNRIQTIIHPPQ